MIRGAYKLVDACKEKISNEQNILAHDGKCSWTEVECLGACINAPMMQINDDYYEDLDKDKASKIFDQILNGENPTLWGRGSSCFSSSITSTLMCFP